MRVLNEQDSTDEIDFVYDNESSGGSYIITLLLKLLFCFQYIYKISNKSLVTLLTIFEEVFCALNLIIKSEK